MAHYMALLYYQQDRYWDAPEELQFLPGYGEFAESAQQAGVLVAGEPLHPVGSATTITVAGGKSGDVVITDGPYADAKEVLGGFFVLDAEDLDEAIRWVAQIPAAWRGKVEVRPIPARSGGAVGQ